MISLERQPPIPRIADRGDLPAALSQLVPSQIVFKNQLPPRETGRVSVLEDNRSTQHCLFWNDVKHSDSHCEEKEECQY
jgi:hypothetical protein